MVVWGQNAMLCEANPHGEVSGLCPETSLRTQGTRVPMIWGWLRQARLWHQDPAGSAVSLSVSLAYGRNR